LRGIEPPNPELTGWVALRGYRSWWLADMITAMMFPSHRHVQEAFHRSQCQENLLRITLAMLIYERRHGTLPPAFTVDATGKPLHSWRVLLLPLLGEEKLHAKIHLDEPWDSPHNTTLHKELVAVYQCPSAKLDPGMTEYTIIIGPNTAFDEKPGDGNTGKRLDSFGPKSANMILVAERVDPICWMDPTNEVTEGDALVGINRDSHGTSPPSTGRLGSEHPGGIHVGLRSGAVTFISENIDDTILAGLLMGTEDNHW